MNRSPSRSGRAPVIPGLISSLRRLTVALLEPSSTVVDAVERRRARLLAALQLVQMVELSMLSVVAGMTEPGRMRIITPIVLLVATLAIGLSHALTRTRHARLGFQGFLAVNLVLAPLTLILMGPAAAPFVALAFLLPPILLASIVTSARGTLIAGLGTLGVTLAIAKLIGPRSWNQDLGNGAMFVVSNLTLIIVFGVHRDRVEADRNGELRTRNEELEALRKSLEDTVQSRTAELSERNAEMRLMLDNIVQGLFTVDYFGRFSSRPSAVFVSWFGLPNQGESFATFLGRHCPAFGNATELAWNQIVDGCLPLELTLDQLPKELSVGERTFHLSFEPVNHSGDLVSFLVVVTDITGDIARDTLALEKRETFDLLEHLLRDRAHFVTAIDEASRLVKGILSPDTDIIGFQRDLHTLKGNSSFFGLVSVGNICHVIETVVAEEHRLPHQTELAPLALRWNHLIGDVDRLLGDRRHMVDVSPEQCDALEKALYNERPHAEILREVRSIRLERVEPHFRRFADQARAIAERLGKIVSVEIVDRGVRLEGKRWAPLWAALAHAVRNAIHHGIELPADRSAKGKPTQGQLTLSAHSTEALLSIEISDDGRGIDWDALRVRGHALGGNLDSERSVVDALFNGGISTADEVSDLSGRGIGVSALADVVRDLGGVLELQSKPNQGTILGMSFALHRHQRARVRELGHGFEI